MDLVSGSSSMGFNPRTPCGVRPNAVEVLHRPTGFQSTHSLRSATKNLKDKIMNNKVSIHALLAECDGRRSLPG